MKLRRARVELADANAFVKEHHRHHDPEVGHRFSLGVSLDGVLVGVAICGRPKSHAIDKRGVLEVLRVAVKPDAPRGSCSFLYATAARCATEMGFRAVLTYTLQEESGASLRGVMWWPQPLDERDPDWDSDGRSGQMALIDVPKKGQDLGPKIRWLWLTGND